MGLVRHAIKKDVPQEAFIPRKLDTSVGATAKVTMNQQLVMFTFLAIGMVLSSLVFVTEVFVIPQMRG